MEWPTKKLELSLLHACMGSQALHKQRSRKSYPLQSGLWVPSCRGKRLEMSDLLMIQRSKHLMICCCLKMLAFTISG